VTVFKGFGFKPHRRIFRRADIPDVYCEVHVREGGVDGNFSSSEGIPRWRTKTVRNSVNPVWNESTELPFYDEADVITIGVFDEDTNRPQVDRNDDFLGAGQIAIRAATLKCSSASSSPTSRLPIDVAITRQGKGTVAFVAILVEIAR
jgi:hypothetical protein